MTPSYHGSCLCGACRIVITQAPKFAIRCYCRDCQQVSGGGHLPQMAVPANAVAFSGPIKAFEKRSDAGNALVFSFCGDCGSPLFKTTSKMPEMLFVMAGALIDPPALDFSRKVFEESRAHWDAD